MTTGTEATQPAEEHAEEGVVRAVYVDPQDRAHLLLETATCFVEPAIATAVEDDAAIVITIESEPLEPPCNPGLVDLQLADPLGDRVPIDGASGRSLVVSEHTHPDPAMLVPADCTAEAARAAVEHGVDGGLRSELLACDAGWMAVDTSTNACPATGEAPAEGCVGNHHIAYFRDDDGHWKIVAFECEGARRQHPDFPASICQS